MKRKQQKVQAFLENLKVDDRIITTGGIYGQVTRLGDQSVQLQIADKVRIEVAKAADRRLSGAGARRRADPNPVIESIMNEPTLESRHRRRRLPHLLGASASIRFWPRATASPRPSAAWTSS